MNLSEAKLTVTIENKKPVELTDFTESFRSLADQYNKFLAEADHFRLYNESKLYIKVIKPGSIITELVDNIPLMVEFVEHGNAILEFSGFLKAGFDYFLGKSETKPKDFDAKDCSNLSNILKPVAKDNGSNITFDGTWNISGETVIINVNSQEANAIQNAIEREKQALKEPSRNIQTKVLFYWDSAKYNDKSKSKDRGYIDSISTKPLKVSFDEPAIKMQLIDTDGNPFHYKFIVDVEVMTVMNVPDVYRILKLHEILDKDDK
jgi:hypothetical protein